MANATATMAYNAVKAMEVAMEVTDNEGYHLTNKLQAVIDNIIAAEGTVTTQEEAMAGIYLATTSLTSYDPTSDEWLQGLFVTYYIQGKMIDANRPTPDTDILFVSECGQYLATLQNAA